MKDKDYIIGDSITFVDFIFYELIGLLDMIYESEKFKKEFPALKKYHDGIGAIKEISCFNRS